jgi:uncharacterized protein YjbI with pentapeptide repeats
MRLILLALLFAKVSAPISEDLKVVSRTALRTAVEKGAVLRHCRILASDAADVLGAASSRGHSLTIDDSVIDGDLVATSVQGAIDIRNSVVNGTLTLSKLTIPSTVNLSRTTIEGAFLAQDATFRGTFVADRTIFKNKVELMGAGFADSASFRGAEFHNTAQFLAGLRRSRDEVKSVPTFHDVDFEEAVFHRSANFIDVHFSGHTNFQFVQFQGDANFGNCHFGAGPRLKATGPFYQTVFAGGVQFRSAEFGNMKFWKTTFRQRTGFEDVVARDLLFMLPSFYGPVDFSDSRIQRLEFHGWLPIESDVTFRGAIIGNAQFFNVLFVKGADFQGANFKSELAFRRSTFGGDVHFEEAAIPKTFTIGNCRFIKGLFANSEQMFLPSPRWAFWREETPTFEFSRTFMVTDDFAHEELRAVDEIQSWRELQHGFNAAGNLEMENYALFHLRSADERRKVGWSRFRETISRWFWGFGVRPFRVLPWLAGVVFVFALLYRTQIDGSLALWPAAKQAVMFSARTAWEFRYGYQNSRTTFFRIATTVESVASKAIVALFAYALSRTSPLLNELLTRLIP